MKCFLLSISAVLSIFAASVAAPDGMATCVVKHSFDTCHHALNR